MTNSHNRTMGGRNSERNNASPQQQYTGSYYGSSRKSRGQKSPSSATFFNSSISPTSSLSSSPPRFSRSDNNAFIGGRPITQPINFNNIINNHHQQYNNSNSHHNQQHRSSPGGLSASSSSASSPPNITLFAGSKCYDAPSPTSLPRPPRHWTSCSVATARINNKSDDFSHNLKLMLNVQA